MTIFGWDMSHFDAPSIGTAAAEGISFLTHKAGGDAPDAELAAWWSGVKGLRSKILVGAYWVLYPGNPRYRAELFLSRLDSQCPGWRDAPFILQVDCEKWGGKASTVPSRAEIQAFCDQLVAKMPKLRPIVYAPKWVYGDSLTGLGYPLWASSYVTAAGGFKSIYPGDGSSKWSAYSGQTPAILQYSSSATIGGQSTSDANAYRGTLAELTALVAPGWMEDDMPTADEIAAAVWGYQFTRPDGPDSHGNTKTSAGAYQCYSDVQANNAAAKVVSTLTPLITAGKVDVGQLVTQLVSPLTAAVLAALPQVDVTPAELQEAIVGALRELATPPAQQ